MYGSFLLFLKAALDEVLADAFSKPLRPDFIVAYIGINFSLEETHHLVNDHSTSA